MAHAYYSKYLMDNIRKAINIYLTRYRLDINALFTFMQERVKVDEEGLKIIQTRILQFKNPTDKITQQELEQYFHLIAAYQAKANIKGKDLSSLTVFNCLTFKSSKAKEEEKKKESSKPAEQVKTQKPKPKQEETNLYPDLPQKEKKIESPIAVRTQQRAQTSFTTRRQIRKSPSSKQAQKKLQIIEENINGQDLTLTALSMSPTEQLHLHLPQAKTMELVSKKLVFISGYDKFGQNYLTPIIKFHIVYGQHQVHRRYTQFQNLMLYLNRQYQGFILPQLPPKQGIRSNFSYFWGVDEVFLNVRQQALQNMLNQLLHSYIVKEDPYLLQFLVDQNFEMESGEGMISAYMQKMKKMPFSLSQLKIYGNTYYNFFKQFKRQNIDTAVIKQYKELGSLLQKCLQIQSYRTNINSNFEQRRQIFKELGYDKDDRNLTVTDFDKMSALTAGNIRNLNKEIEKYLDLQADLSWVNHLANQTRRQSGKDSAQLQKRLEETQSRMTKMEQNLMRSMEQLREDKEVYLQEVAVKMVQWRKRIHP